MRRAHSGQGDLEARERRAALMSGMQRWYIDVSKWGLLSTEHWNILLELLPREESTRIQKFLRENDRRLALGSRLLQRAVISKVFHVDFAEADIRRTSEKKPYFAGLAQALRDGEHSSLLNNWNFNVSHHGKYVAIASEPICLCGVDLVDTKRRANEPGPADEYLRYFEDHFSRSEWEAIRRAPSDEIKLRRFYLNWGLKEAFVKAVGQGLGFSLCRVSFVAGDWLDCCNLTHNSEGRGRQPTCICQRSPASTSASSTRHDPGGPRDIGMEGRWAGKDRVGCTCNWRSAAVEVDGIARNDWVFRVFPLLHGYAACTARGPPSACSPSGQAAGVISDPDVEENVFEEGLSLPQPPFREVELDEVIPQEVATVLRALGARADNF